MEIKEIQTVLTPLFTKYKAVLTYLFGSQANKRVTPLSDIDIAVFLPEDLNKDQLLASRLALMDEISMVLKSEQIDLIILNNAPLFLKFQVISNGCLIFNTDNNKRIAFEVSTRSQYFDFLYFYRVQNRYLIRKIKEDRYGSRPSDYSKAPTKIRRLHQSLTRIPKRNN